MDRWLERTWSNLVGAFRGGSASTGPAHGSSSAPPLGRRASTSLTSGAAACTGCRRSLPPTHTRRHHSRNASAASPTSRMLLRRSDEFQTLRTYDMDRSVHVARRYPRFTFVMDEHPIRSLEPTIGPNTATLLHFVAHLIGQIDRAITAGEISTTKHGRNWVNRLHGQILVSLQGGPSPSLPSSPSTAVLDIHAALQAQLDAQDILLDATWQAWLDREWSRILQLASMPHGSPSLASRKKLLVLDLDRTLWFRSYRPFDTADFVAVYELPQSHSSSSIYVSIRPGAQFLLDSVAPFYDIAVFTASDRRCTDDLVDLVDAKRLIKYRLYRDACTTDVADPSILRKDLSLTGRPLSEVVVVDDNPTAWVASVENTIICKPYGGNHRDVEMYSLTHQLLALHDVADVRMHLAHLPRGQTPHVA
ncbi:hypothetical protein H310_09980 [Aphanomyces invadans]|uniref:Mitochondrial import inner membrane translocase subunit TIM50 n=1 Tax=Aphanomyces invadans TaxID=157072 RepID=A0A024TSQ6_9STRA|nr:hypothetical protein H310_09980 [Aphanomyces invadans]ETV97185.1 hypothetical protein H310_09980 [Aphanomyces invadans]|eukprot:XP_008874431.1 hypothetical protein H310_09980 [Aphanomyces invadans]